jgi:hypothetical protein
VRRGGADCCARYQREQPTAGEVLYYAYETGVGAQPAGATCVIDHFVGMYGEELKIARDQYINTCKEYYKNQCWSVEHGINPRCVNSICEKYDITHYGLDVNQSCIIKNTGKHNNKKTSIHFAVDNHMYLILDDVMRKSLVETVKEEENFNTSLLANEEDNFFFMMIMIL